MTTKKRLTPQPASLSVYLGGGDERAQRIERLAELAHEHGASTPSELVRKLADGELRVIPAPDAERQSA